MFDFDISLFMLSMCNTADPTWGDTFDSNVSFHWNVEKRRSSFEPRAFENVTPSGIGCTIIRYFDSSHVSIELLCIHECM